ncbi:MAG: NAD(P)/FAD-dependent oxidoreductase, partial [Robiginitomaculum sp.]|nr:NAD(P)/FAD-dependent oxidoreductase [Robiginitomaculum sp.]
EHLVTGQNVSCLVNPRACHELELTYHPVPRVKKIAVVGAGPAGLSFATVAAGRGHDVTLFDKAADIGGQFNLARKIPGKEEFSETIRYYRRMIDVHSITLRLNTEVTADMLRSAGFDEVVIATGILPRLPEIYGNTQAKVVSYIDVIKGHKKVGQKVAIMGAGGIGFDVAEFLSVAKPEHNQSIDEFCDQWGIDQSILNAGGLHKAQVELSVRNIWLLQRKTSKPGKTLGKTTGWTHRITLGRRGVKMINGAEYVKIDDAGLHVLVRGTPEILAVDTIIICAGQTSLRSLYDGLKASQVNTHLVGGAFEAGELDAKRAIDQASRLAARI